MLNTGKKNSDNYHDIENGEQKILSEMINTVNNAKSQNGKPKQEVNKIANIGLIKQPNNKDLILVSFEKQNHKFSFYGNNNTLLGYFTIQQLIKFLGNRWDENFMKHVDTSISDEIIKTFIGSADINEAQIVNIKLLSHLQSPFMGNIEMLMKVNNALQIFESKILNTELNEVKSIKIQEKIKLTIKQFIYMMLNQSLKVIAAISEEIKNDKSRDHLKEILLKYSVGITYRLSNFIRDQLDTQMTQYNNLNENITKIYNIRRTMSDKLDKLTNVVETQNERIDMVNIKLSETVSDNSSSASKVRSSSYKSANTDNSARTSTNNSSITASINSSATASTNNSSIRTSTNNSSHKSATNSTGGSKNSSESKEFSITSFLDNSSDSSENGYNSDTDQSGSSSEIDYLSENKSYTASDLSAIYNI
jgi:hypothetical protein